MEEYQEPNESVLKDMSVIDHIVFDVGHVLLHWDPELIYVDLIPGERERRFFLTNVCSAEWNIEQDRGRDWSDAEELLIADHPEKADLIRAYRLNWNKCTPHAHDGIAKIMVSLVDAGHDVTILSNFNQHTYAESTERFTFLKRPRGATVSGEVELIKPDPNIYHLHAKTFGLTPEKTLFLDDSAANIQAARNCSWNAVQFAGREGPTRLRQLLRGAGVSLPVE